MSKKINLTEMFARIISSELVIVANKYVSFQVPFGLNSEKGRMKLDDENLPYSFENGFRYIYLVDDKKEKGIIAIINSEYADILDCLEPGAKGDYFKNIQPYAETELFVSNIGKENERIVSLMKRVACEVNTDLLFNN